MEREAGWYWVRWNNEDAWQCAEWDDGGWWMAGEEMHIGNSLVVGPRIPAPNESPE
ncbi:hypothetical protein [Vreelandella maris]|uniref:hypothetical protein n=1 Tax=Vreelandella maris TaxID=2729617 RepID=UPI0030EC6630|tara:strand:+ start:955 stop:1122 length:168 start_codon:yes stop_codon:yes gene_type:complete